MILEEAYVNWTINYTFKKMRASNLTITFQSKCKGSNDAD